MPIQPIQLPAFAGPSTATLRSIELHEGGGVACWCVVFYDEATGRHSYWYGPRDACVVRMADPDEPILWADEEV